MLNRELAIRSLVPKSFSFDGYNELNCPNERREPFFSSNSIKMGQFLMHTWVSETDILNINFSDPCPKYNSCIKFSNYQMTLREFAEELKQAIQNGADFISLPIKTIIYSYRFHQFGPCNVCEEENAACQMLREKHPKVVYAAVSFNTNEVKKALEVYYGLTNLNDMTKGGNSMKTKKKIFGMNFEFGRCKDQNIASTLMGIAVRNTSNGSWYVFDSANNTRKNIANMKMGNFPIFLLPVAKLEVGDLTKMDGSYYYVKAVNSNNTITLLSAADGIIKEMIPEESLIPGMTLYTKVMAFDTNSLMNTSSKENMGNNVLAAMCMMQWAGGQGDEFSLDNIKNDSFNGLGECLPMLMAMGGNNMGSMFQTADGKVNLPMLMMLDSGNGSSDMDNMMQMVILQNLLGGNTSGSPFAGILPSNLVPQANESNVTGVEGEVSCIKCGDTYPAGTNFCPKCGGKTETVATTCRNCKAILMKGAKFCHKCGTKVAPDTCEKCGHTVGKDDAFCIACGAELKPKSAPATSKTELPPVVIE